MKKTAILFVLFSICATIMQAQGTWIKLSLENGYKRMPNIEQPTALANRISVRQTTQFTNNLSLAVLRITPGRRLWEMSFSGVIQPKIDVYSAYQDSVSSNTLGKMSIIDLGLTMEYGFNIGPVCDPSKNRNSFFMSVFMNPLYQQFRFSNPIRSIDFDQSFQQMGINLGVSPRIIFQANKRFLFDLSLKLPMLSYRYTIQDYNNPALTEQQQISKVFDFGMFDGMMLRLGIGWRPKKAKAPVD
jgi:hypothetical protein